MLNEIDIMRKRHYWKWTFPIIRYKFYITFSNCRLKKRPKLDLEQTRRGRERSKMIKRETLEANGGHCPVCGMDCRLDEIEIHHILPVARFPELKDDRRNMTVLCWRCHKDVHQNPFRNAELQQAKAQELGIDIKEIYHIERKQQ